MEIEVRKVTISLSNPSVCYLEILLVEFGIEVFCVELHYNKHLKYEAFYVNTPNNYASNPGIEFPPWKFCSSSLQLEFSQEIIKWARQSKWLMEFLKDDGSFETDQDMLPVQTGKN